MITRVLAALITAALVLFALTACDGDSGGDDTPTPPASTATASGTATPNETPSGEIRERDLENDPAVRALMTDTGGEYVQENVIYADLTDDSIDDAVVPVASGGTLGNLAFIVLTPTESGTSVLLKEQPTQSGGIALDVVDGKLLTLEPVFGPDDPECCPSMLRKTTYGWNGAALALEDQETVENPGGVVKPTQTP
jgi:hypothetical protein